MCLVSSVIVLNTLIFQGQTYHIPISLTLQDTHPYHGPIAFVKPTPDMMIKESKHVDASGKIYLPYLHEWAHPNYDLLGLVQMCVIIFSEQPPVFARPKNQPQGGLPYPVNGSPGGGYPPQQPGFPQQPGPGYPVQGQHPGYPPSYGAGGGYPPVGNSYSAGGGAAYPPQQTPGYPPNPGAGTAYPMPTPYPPATQAHDQRPGTGETSI